MYGKWNSNFLYNRNFIISIHLFIIYTYFVVSYNIIGKGIINQEKEYFLY